MIRSLALLSLLLSLFTFAHAQGTSNSTRLAGVWATGGYGFPLYGSAAEYLSVAAATSSDKVFIVRYANSQKHDAAITPDESVAEWGFLAGEIERPAKRLLVYAGVGAGSAQVTTRGAFLGWKRDAMGTPTEQQFAESHSNNFAVLYEAQVFYAPVHFAAIGISFFGDYNSAKPLAAATLNLHLGLLPLQAPSRRSSDDEE
jgi:hypothetical protein